MKRLMPVLCVSLLFGGAIVTAADSKSDRQHRGAKPNESPGWIVVEDDFFFPWRYEFVDWHDEAVSHYRQNEIKAAAKEVIKAESWLRLAATHAYPETKHSLLVAADDLHQFHQDLSQGKLIDAKKLDEAMANAEHSLAQWHYFKAKDYFGKNEECWAAKHLQTASNYLQHAATSARFQFGPDAEMTFAEIDKQGKLTEDGVSVDRNLLEEHLHALRGEIDQMAATLKNAGERRHS